MCSSTEPLGDMGGLQGQRLDREDGGIAEDHFDLGV